MTPIEQELTTALIGAIQCENDQAVATYNLPETFEGFNGHFPGHPILPAVLQIMLGKLVCSEFSATPLSVVSIGRAKFMQEIAPNMDIQVQAVQKAITEGNERRFSITVLTNDTKASTFSMTCKEASHA